MKPAESKQHLYTIISTMVLFKRGINPTDVHVVLSLCLLDGGGEKGWEQEVERSVGCYGTVSWRREEEKIHAEKSEIKGI